MVKTNRETICFDDGILALEQGYEAWKAAKDCSDKEQQVFSSIDNEYKRAQTISAGLLMAERPVDYAATEMQLAQITELRNTTLDEANEATQKMITLDKELKKLSFHQAIALARNKKVPYETVLGVYSFLSYEKNGGEPSSCQEQYYQDLEAYIALKEKLNRGHSLLVLSAFKVTAYGSNCTLEDGKIPNLPTLKVKLPIVKSGTYENSKDSLKNFGSITLSFPKAAVVRVSNNRLLQPELGVSDIPIVDASIQMKRLRDLRTGLGAITVLIGQDEIWGGITPLSGIRRSAANLAIQAAGIDLESVH